MAAPDNNKNAEKWSIEKAKDLLNSAIELSSQKKETDKGVTYTYDFIGEIAREQGQYKEIYTYLSDKFPELKKLHNRLISNVEANCFYNAKKGFIKEATAIVNLKANHKWSDRVHQDTTHSGSITWNETKSYDE